ncbi:hypothetical protein BC831DRAFT_445536 [Entophlyctis helioformis]|nr:hypothetical protein BC831DRAFT_445536 [Entophlyctis helioformis]
MSSYFRISTNSNQLTRIPLRGTSLDADCALSGPYKAGLTRHYEQLENTRLPAGCPTAHDGCLDWAGWLTMRTPQLARVLLAASCPHASLSMQAYQVDSLASLDITSWLGTEGRQPHGISDVSPVRESSTSPCPTIASAASDQGPQPLSTVADRTSKKRERDAQDMDHADVWLQTLAQDDGSRTTSPSFHPSGSAYLPSPYMPKTPHYSPIEPRWSPEASFIHPACSESHSA